MAENPAAAPQIPRPGIDRAERVLHVAILAAAAVLAIIIFLLLARPQASPPATQPTPTPSSTPSPPADAGQGAGQTARDQPTGIESQVSECISSNPSMTAAQCRDLKLSEAAMSNNDRALCSMISDAGARAHCEGYFG